jgi:hypothetical protein
VQWFRANIFKPDPASLQIPTHKKGEIAAIIRPKKGPVLL